MQVTERIHAIRHPFKLSLGDGRFAERFVYSYLIVGETLCLIDAGVTATGPALLDHIRELGRSPEEISWLLLTHSHPDHIGGAAVVKRAAPQARVAVHPAERVWVEDIQVQYRERPIPNLFELVAEGLPVDHELRDGECIPWEGGRGIRVVHTPGHSPGSVSFLDEAEGALFTGDGVPAAGSIPIYVDPVASRLSVERLRRLPDVRILFSSWEEPLFGEQIASTMAEGLGYIEMIDGLVREIHGQAPHLSLEELTRQALERLGIRLPMLFYMVQATFRGHREALKG